jgi:lauroyl/myristoyl acyltransferase
VNMPPPQKTPPPRPAIATAPVTELLASAVASTPNKIRTQGPNIANALRQLFPGMATEQAKQVAWRFVRNELRNQVIRGLQQHGRFEDLGTIVHCHGQEAVLQRKHAGEPIILAFAHIGPPLAVMYCVSKLGIEVTGIRHSRIKTRLSIPGIDIWDAVAEPQRVALFPKHAVSKLNAGGTVLLGMDGVLGSSRLNYPCLGRDMDFAQGLFTIQKLSKATVIPVFARWEKDGSISCHFEAPLTEGAPLDISQIAAWLERKTLRHPGQKGNAPRSGALREGSLAMTYFRGRDAYYHWRWGVSRSCSEWEGVGPPRYGRQT